MSFAVVLALTSSLLYGASDFLGALTARSVTVLKASVAIYLAATVAVTAGLAIVPWAFSEKALWAGSIAGLFAAVGMVTFYAALAIGPMSLLAPLIALIQTAIPVVVSAATGQTLQPVAWIAIVIALVATTLISVPPRTEEITVHSQRISPRGAVLALASGVTLGFAVVSLDAAPSNSGVFPAFLDVVVGLVLLLPLLAFRALRDSDRWLGDAPTEREGKLEVVASNIEVATQTERSSRRVWALAAVSGLLLGSGNILLVAALHSGNLAVVAVLLSLYPLTTVLLAWALLKERISPAQLVGISLAIIAAVMLGLA